MARELKRAKLTSRLQRIVLSPFILPSLFFAFALLTIPVIFLTTQYEQDIRQNAAILHTKSIALNTDDISYRGASAEVITNDSMALVSLITALIIIAVFTLIVIIYRKRLSAM